MMLTDSVSQCDTYNANHIPKSLQKLINDIHKAQGKKPKNPPLNITSIQKPKFNVTVKKKPKVNKNPDPKSTNQEVDSSKNSVQILDQRTITDFYQSVKNRRDSLNFSLQKENESVTTGDRNLTEIDCNTAFENNQNRMDDEIMVLNDQDNSTTKFQNSEYTDYSDSRNTVNNESSDNRFPEENGSFDNEIQIDINTSTNNWKTFTDIVNSGGALDLPDKRQKRLVSDVFYRNKNPRVRINRDPIGAEKNSNHLGTPRDFSTNQNENNVLKATVSKDWIAAMKEDREQMKNLLQQVKSVNNVISKARQEIMKFCGTVVNE